MATIMLVINLDAKIVLLLYGLIKSNFIVPLLNSSLIIELAIKGDLSGLQFGLKQLIGYGLNQIW